MMERRNSLEELHCPINDNVIEKIVEGISARMSKNKCPNPNCADLLVVDDSEFNRFTLIQILQKYKFSCKTVFSARSKTRQLMVKMRWRNIMKG